MIMIDALEKSFILRDLADRVYYLRNLSAYENKNLEVSEAIANELDNIVLELAEMPGVDFAANWRTDRGKFEDGKYYLITVGHSIYFGGTTAEIYLGEYVKELERFYVDVNGSGVMENDVLAWMPAPDPYRKGE